MTRTEALATARSNVAAFRMADFRFLAGREERPDPAAFGLSGTVRQPGNTVTVGDFRFHVEEVEPSTFPVHAGF